jgi:HK97 family phage major capsid protein
MRKWLLKQIKAKEEARAALKAKGKAISNTDADAALKEIRGIEDQIDALDKEIQEFRTQLDSLPAEKAETRTGNKEKAEDLDNEDDDEGEGEFRSEKLNDKAEKRGTAPKGALNPLGTYSMGGDQDESRAIELREAAEKRGTALKESRSVTVGSSNVILPAHQATDIRPTFNEVSTLLDRVTVKPLNGGESFKQPYITGYGTGDYTTEGQDYTEAEATFGYAEINKAKVTAYAEDTEELQKLPAADYDGEVMKGIRIASRKKLTRALRRLLELMLIYES